MEQRTRMTWFHEATVIRILANFLFWSNAILKAVSIVA